MAFAYDRTTSAHRQNLADGSVVQLEGVTFGTSHSFEYGVSHWHRWLKQYVPFTARWVKSQPVWGGGSSSSWETLSCWITVKNSKGEFEHEPWESFHSVDVHGCKLPVQNFGSGSSSIGGQRKFSITRVELTALPLGGRTFKVVGFLKRNSAPVIFEIGNPARTSTSVWHPEQWPVSYTNAEMTFTFTGFVSDSRLLCVPQFEVRRRGELLTNWQARFVQYEDAVGNSGDFLCTNVSAWKLSATLGPRWDSEFPPEKIWRLTNITIPRPGQIVMLNRTSFWAGITGCIVAIAGPGVYTITNGAPARAAPIPANGGLPERVVTRYSRDDWTMDASSFHPQVWLVCHDRMDGESLMLRGVDNTGSTFLSTNRVGPRETRWVCLPVTSNATSVDLELVRHDIYPVTFVVRAPRLVGKQPPK